MALLDDLLSKLLGDFSTGLRIEDDKVRIKLLRTNFDLYLLKPDPEKAASIREREGDVYAIPIGIRIVNRNSGKEVRGLDNHFIHPWWLRRFVYEMAAGVGYIEREWDCMSPEFIAKMEKDD